MARKNSSFYYKVEFRDFCFICINYKLSDDISRIQKSVVRAPVVCSISLKIIFLYFKTYRLSFTYQKVVCVLISPTRMKSKFHVHWIVKSSTLFVSNTYCGRLCSIGSSFPSIKIRVSCIIVWIT